MNNVLEYQLFVNGKDVPGSSGKWMDIINPANSEVVARVPHGTQEDVDKAVAAAKNAFDSGVWSETPVAERVRVLSRISSVLMGSGKSWDILKPLHRAASSAERSWRMPRKWVSGFWPQQKPLRSCPG